ncbi:hypothetical protein CMK18_21125, partial [Candidatus Poribacteria bacterium]|nr:hypothetical protein [Candidatus Poribacteria bacterium]
MKSGDKKILGKVTQDQTDQFFDSARGDDAEKLTGEAATQGMIRYNNTIDRLEGVVRSEDYRGRPHPGRWSPFITGNELGACNPDAADMFSSYIGTVLNSAEEVKNLYISLIHHRNQALPQFPYGRFLPTECSKDVDDLARVVVGASNVSALGIDTNPNRPLIGVGQDEWPTSCRTDPIQSTITIDLFNFFDIATSERKNFYITPYMCMSGLDMRPLDGHAYNVEGGKGFLQSITDDPEDPRFGQFRVRLEKSQLTHRVTFSLYLTANRFDNFVPTCANPLPIQPPPAMPSDIIINCKPDEYSAATMKDLNVREWIENEYWQWMLTPVNVTVEVFKDAIVGGIDTTELPAGSTIIINNSGDIIGRGGRGGDGEGNFIVPETNLGAERPPTSGGPGHPAILGDDVVPMTINNALDARIIGGSGGGAGGLGLRTFTGDLLAGASGGGGHARGSGGQLASGDWRNPDINPVLPVTFSDGKVGKDGDFLSGGSFEISRWAEEQYKIPGNFANIHGYGTRLNGRNLRSGYGGTNGSAGGSSILADFPAQGVILLKQGPVPPADRTLTIDGEEFIFKTCPTDTRTCWDGSVKARGGSNCEFAACPIPPDLEFVRDSVTQENTFKFEYRLLKYGEGNTKRTAVARIILDNDTPINFPDPTSVPITISVVNELRDTFAIDVRDGNGFGKGRTFNWDFANNGSNVEFSFDIKVYEFTDAGEGSTISDGSPYFGDLKFSMLGFDNETVAQLEVQVLEPETTVRVIPTKPKSVYEQSNTGGNPLWGGSVSNTATFTLGGDVLNEDGVTLRCLDSNNNDTPWLLKSDGNTVGFLPQTLKPTVAYGSSFTELESIPDTSMSVQPFDYIDSYASLNGLNQGVKFTSTADYNPPLQGMEQIRVEGWFRFNEVKAGMMFNKEQNYELAVFPAPDGKTLELAYATWNNSGFDNWKWIVLSGYKLHINRWYSIAMVMQGAVEPFNTTDLDIRVDGVSVYSKNVPNMGDNTNSLNFGCRGSNTTSLLAGDMTEIRVWRGNAYDLKDLDQGDNREWWSKRMSGVGDIPHNLNARLVLWHPLVSDQNNPGTAAAEMNVDFIDNQSDTYTTGAFPDILPPGESTYNIVAEYTDNADGNNNNVLMQLNHEKVEAVTMRIRKQAQWGFAQDADGNWAQELVPGPFNPRGPLKKMFRANLDVETLHIDITGTGFPVGEKITVTHKTGNGFLSIQTKPRAHVKNHPENNSLDWAVDNSYTVTPGEYNLMISARINPDAVNFAAGIGAHLGELIFTAGDFEKTLELDAEMTEGRTLTKQFTPTDFGYSNSLDMKIVYTDKLQYGSNGLGNKSEVLYTISGGAGGSGGSIPGEVSGGRGIGGKTRIENRESSATDEIIWRIGTGGSVGGSFTAAGGITGSLGQTGGNSSHWDTTDSQNHTIQIKSGGGGGGYSHLIATDNGNVIPGWEIIAPGGGGGSGAVDFGTCTSVRSLPINGRNHYNIHILNDEVLETFSGDIIQTGDPSQSLGLPPGGDGIIVLPHEGNSEVGASGGGGGGLPGSVGGWTGLGPGTNSTVVTGAG